MSELLKRYLQEKKDARGHAQRHRVNALQAAEELQQELSRRAETQLNRALQAAQHLLGDMTGSGLQATPKMSTDGHLAAIELSMSEGTRHASYHIETNGEQVRILQKDGRPNHPGGTDITAELAVFGLRDVNADLIELLAKRLIDKIHDT